MPSPDAYVAGIQRDLESGLRPEDIAVVGLDPVSLLSKIEHRLRILGIKALALTSKNKDQFRQPGHVTISSIRRAKGNEAYKVYALNLHMAGPAEVSSTDDEMVARNQVFVALTRTKLWCVAVGRASAIIAELSAASKQDGSIRFPAFNQASLKRSMADIDSLQQTLV